MPEFHLPDTGFIMIDLRIEERVLAAALHDAGQREYANIFKEVGCSDMDAFRAQSRVECRTAALRTIRSRLNEHARCLDSKWTAMVFSFLRSQPGGDAQAPHQDYSSDDIQRAASTNAGSIPASAIVSLTPGTTLTVYPCCFFECRGDPVVVDIPPGFAVIFRGDLLHGGSAYTSLNYRIHCYLTVPDNVWTPDVVTSAATAVYPCKFCDKQYTKSSSSRQHQYLCKANPNYERNMAVRRAKQQGQFKCQLCDHSSFASSGGLRNHHFKKHK